MTARKREGVSASVAEIVEARWEEGQTHLANASVELLLALRAAVSVPIDMAELRSRRSEDDAAGTPATAGAAGWRMLRDVIDGAIGRLRALEGDPTIAVRRETLAAIQKALLQEIIHLEKGAAGPDVAILAQAFKSVKAIIDRQIDLLEEKPPKRRPAPRGRARKVTVE
jgi:hypothetical protein